MRHTASIVWQSSDALYGLCGAALGGRGVRAQRAPSRRVGQALPIHVSTSVIRECPAPAPVSSHLCSG